MLKWSTSVFINRWAFERDAKLFIFCLKPYFHTHLIVYGGLQKCIYLLLVDHRAFNVENQWSTSYYETITLNNTSQWVVSRNVQRFSHGSIYVQVITQVSSLSWLGPLGTLTRFRTVLKLSALF